MKIAKIRYVGQPIPDVPYFDAEVGSFRNPPVISFSQSATEGIGILHITEFPYIEGHFVLHGVEVTVSDDNGNYYVYKSIINDPWGPIHEDWYNYEVYINDLPIGWSTSEWGGKIIVSPSELPGYGAVREVCCYVEEHDKDGNLIQTFTEDDYLQNWTLNCNAESAFIGKLASYSLELNLLKMDSNIIQPIVGHYVKIYVGYKVGEVSYYRPYPRMWIYESAEVDNKQYHLQCYDDLVGVRWSGKTFNDIPNYEDLNGTLRAIFDLFGIEVNITDETNPEWFTSTSDKRLNYNPDDSVIEIIEDWLEINGCDGYMGYDDKFTAKRYRNYNEYQPDSILISESIGSEITISGIGAVTSLGDNVIYGNQNGNVITLVDNGFIDNHPNINAIMDWLRNTLGLRDIFEQRPIAHNFEQVTRCNLRLEPWDRINNSHGFKCFHCDYTIVYDGGLRESMRWEYPEVEQYDFNPPNLGNVLQDTSAKVDKVNQKIELNVSRISDLSEQISNLVVDLNGIRSTVSRLDTRESNNQATTDAEIEAIRKWTELAQTAEQVQILINQALQGGVNSVTTTTGYTFDQDGLKISRSDSNISTVVNNDGLQVLGRTSDGAGAMLIANHNGVDATNLTANNYLQIGHSRFQEYTCGTPHRTGLFYWQGKDVGL